MRIADCGLLRARSLDNRSRSGNSPQRHREHEEKSEEAVWKTGRMEGWENAYCIWRWQFRFILPVRNFGLRIDPIRSPST
jgi:hypothetical protein